MQALAGLRNKALFDATPHSPFRTPVKMILLLVGVKLWNAQYAGMRE
jgi:hypothetical protein